MRMKLNNDQQKAYDLIQANQFCYLLGDAGTGKSFLLNFIIDELRSNPKQFGLVTAPTGIAAINLDGMTIHNAMRGLRSLIDSGVHQRVDYVLIDEVSMCRADLMDKFDETLRKATGVKTPFGGAKVILCGDVGQLPPIMSKPAEREMIKQEYDNSPYFFSSKAFKKVGKDWTYCVLKEVVRQKDQNFVDLLRRSRAGDDTVVNEFNKICSRDEIQDGIILCTTNARVDYFNNAFLDNLETKAYEYNCDITGIFDSFDLPCPTKLVLKVGAKVIVTKNIYEDGDLVLSNGTRGVIEELGKFGASIRLDNGDEHYVTKQEWQNYSLWYDDATNTLSETVIGTASQLPLRLCWAMTVHKAQGQTFERVTIDTAANFFEKGQLYVALSRASTIEGLNILGELGNDDLKTDVRAIEFSEGLK